MPCEISQLKDYRVVRVASYNEHTAALVEPFDNSHAGGDSVPVSNTFRQQMRSIVNEDEFADVTFLIEGESVYAHRAILAQRCDFFASMFRSGMRESTERTITIPNVRKHIFVLLLEYLYTDTIQVPVAQSVELYIVADLYDLERLREICMQSLRRNLSAETAGPLLQTAADHHCIVIKDYVMNFVVENFDAVSKTNGIQQVSHGLLLEILSRR